MDQLDLGLAQIYPIWDEDTDEERLATSASFEDPYLAILRDDSSLLVLQADDSGDLDEVSLPDEIVSSKWRSSCLYHDKHQAFSGFSPLPNTAEGNVLMFLLSMDNKLSVSLCSLLSLQFQRLTNKTQIFNYSDMKLLSVIDGVDCLQPVLSAEPPRRSNSRAILKEVVVADLGDRWTPSPYLIVRSPALNV
jgi:cleavage and polyadenylation specificity factor subunit 1